MVISSEMLPWSCRYPSYLSMVNGHTLIWFCSPMRPLYGAFFCLIVLDRPKGGSMVIFVWTVCIAFQYISLLCECPNNGSRAWPFGILPSQLIDILPIQRFAWKRYTRQCNVFVQHHQLRRKSDDEAWNSGFLYNKLCYMKDDVQLLYVVAVVPKERNLLRCVM